MADFDLDLRAVEEEIEGAEDDGGGERRVVLDVLDGSTPDEEWVDLVEGGDVLVLDVEGDVNRRAAGFARDVQDLGGHLVHFRGFLIVAPPAVSVDRDRLQ